MAFTQDAIFDRERRRSDTHPAQHDESTFDFYNRCANEVIGSVRDLLEQWFAHYPPGRDRNDVGEHERCREIATKNAAAIEVSRA
jgi:hypothetical protein